MRGGAVCVCIHKEREGLEHSKSIRRKLYCLRIYHKSKRTIIKPCSKFYQIVKNILFLSSRILEGKIFFSLDATSLSLSLKHSK